MGFGYIPKKSPSGTVLSSTSLPGGRLNLGGEIPAGSTLSSEVIIDDGANWHSRYMSFVCLTGKVKATIYWDYGGQDIILFHSDRPFMMCDDVLMAGDGIIKLRLEVKNLDLLGTQKAALTMLYDVE